MVTSVSDRLLSEDWPGVGGMLHWDAFFEQATVPPSAQQNNDAILDDLESWTTNFFGDAVFDWIGFEDQH